MYNELMEQYKQLSDEEKNALLVYKTGLGLLINDLDNDPNFEEYYYRYFRVYVSPQNALIKNLVFGYIDFKSVDTFRESIYRIKDILEVATSKIKTTKDAHVFRCISSNKEIKGLAKGDFISTSLSFGETLKYAVAGSNIHMYDIKLPEGSTVGVCPYSVLDDKKKDRFIFSTHSDQDEIILNANNYDFDLTRSFDNDGIMYFEVTARDITNERSKK